jgi:hypothetical protein
MNDRDPDDLFDALRRAWADSRPEPSASLWGRVQAQIPPPAVQPQLRRRKRQAGWLLSLLLLLLSGLSWLYWPTPGSHLREPRRGSSASQAPRAASEQITAASKQITLEGNGAVVSQRDTPQYLTYPPVLATPAPAVSERAEPGHGRGVRSPFATNSFVMDSSATTRVSKSEKAVAARPLMPTTGSSSATWLTSAAHPRTPAGTVLPGSRARRLRKAAVFPQLPARRTSLASTRERSTESPHSEEGPVSPELRTAQSQPVQNQSGLVTRTRQSPDTARSSSPGVLENGEALAGRREPAGLAPDGRTTLLGPGTTSIDLLVLRRVAVAAATFPLPDPHLRADTSIAKPVVRPLRRWSIQVLAGPIRSYRQLGNEEFTLWGSTASLPPFPNRLGPGAAAANRRAEYEKPGTGWSLQLQMQRVLTGRWSLSVGVGYQEYAVESLYPVVPFVIIPSGGLAPPYTSRDTYRFVSVPVRVSYTLGYVGPVRYGLLAGPDLALYVGGTSAGTGLSPQAWDTAGSPYRPLHVALSAGLDLRYQLGPGLQGIVQPNVTTYLTSLTKPETGLAPRHLQGVGILVGLSYGLPTRP